MCPSASASEQTHAEHRCQPGRCKQANEKAEDRRTKHTYHERLLLHARLAQNGVQLGQRVLQDVVGADVDLGHHKENGHLECQSHPHVLLAHANNACTMSGRLALVKQRLLNWPYTENSHLDGLVLGNALIPKSYSPTHMHPLSVCKLRSSRPCRQFPRSPPTPCQTDAP